MNRGPIHWITTEAKYRFGRICDNAPSGNDMGGALDMPVGQVIENYVIKITNYRDFEKLGT